MIDATKEKAIKDLSPIIPSLTQVNQGVHNIDALFSSVDIETPLRNQLTVYKVSYPAAPPPENSEFLEKAIIPQLDANRPRGESAAAAAAKVKTIQEIFDQPYALSSGFTATLTAQFVKVGVPLSQAQEITALLAQHRVSQFAYAVADYAPLSLRSQAFMDLLINIGLPFIQEQPGLSSSARQAADYLQQSASRLDSERLYSSVAREFSPPTASAQLSQPQFFQTSPNELAPYMNFLFSNPLSQRLKSGVTKLAVNKFVSSAVGQKVKQFAVKKLGEKIVTGALAKLGVTSVVPEVGVPLIVASALKDAASYIKRHSKEFIAAVAGLAALLVFGIGAAIATTVFVFGGISLLSVSLTGAGAGAGIGSSGVISAADRTSSIFSSLGGELATTTVTPIVFTILALPIIIALFLFIINSGAYIVPPSSAGLGTNTPHCWPAHGQITQGPPGTTTCHDLSGAVVTCSHVPGNLDAIDIGAVAGTPIFATHNGTAYRFPDNGNGYGNYITIVSTDHSFSTLYGHMPDGGFTVSDGQPVTTGTQIGVVDNTGNSSGNHVHYEYLHFSPPAINQIVPYYTIPVSGYEQTTGCFAQDQAGGRP